MRTTHKFNVSPKLDRTYNGIVFDSKKEMNRYILLEQDLKTKKISNLQRQVSYELQPAFTDYTGKKQRAICYIADFVYEKDGKCIVEDVKSEMTRKLPDYRMKKKMFLYKYQNLCFQEWI